MRFADPQACPDCRGPISGENACPRCGLDLTSVEVRQLWQTLLQADELLARASQRRMAPTQPRAPAAAPAPAAPPPAASQPVAPTPPSVPTPPVPPQPAPTQPGPDAATSPVPPPTAPSDGPPRPTPTPAPPGAYGSFQPYPAQPAAPKPSPERQWSVGTVLLVLGAFGLIVAGLIFVTRSWDDFGLAGKTAVLLGVTAVMGALGVWVTRRPLRASAEAVWTVFLALLTLDVFAARHEDLLGTGAVEIQWAWVVWGVVALALSVLVAGWARQHVKADLVAPAVVGGFAITMAGIGAGAVAEDWDFAWRAVVALVVAGLLALATRPAGLRTMTVVARVVVAGFFVAAYVAAFVELVDHPAVDDLVGGGHGVPLLLMAVASVVVAAVVPPARVPGSALGVFAVTSLVVTPASQGWEPEGLWLAVAGVAAVLVVVGSRGTGDWARGVRLGSVPAVGGLVLLHLGLLLDAVETVGRVLDDPWRADWDTRVDLLSVDDYRVWVVPVVVAALLVVGWFLPRWPELSAARPHATSVFAGFVVLGAVDAVVATRSPVWACAAVLVAVGAALAVAQARGLASHAGPVAVVSLAAASMLAAASQGVSASAWLAGAAVLAFLATAKGPVVLRQAYAAAAVLLGLAGVAATVDLLDVADEVPALVVLVASVALLAAAGTVLKEHISRLPVEAAAAVALFVSLVVPGSTAELAVRWTVAGVALVALGFAVSDRRWYVWPGIGALVVAYVLLIVDSGFSFVEAYTLPLGAVALAVGVYLAGKRPDTSTWLLLGPGLAVALLPSVPQALVDPTDLRALLLGAGSLVVLAVGVRLGWQAPFVAGVTLLTLLVLFNIGPYANAAPRVVLIAAVSALLLGFGITWEDRVRDGRKIVGFVRGMR